jgi:hypothetical protein
MDGDLILSSLLRTEGCSYHSAQILNNKSRYVEVRVSLPFEKQRLMHDKVKRGLVGPQRNHDCLIRQLCSLQRAGRALGSAGCKTGSSKAPKLQIKQKPLMMHTRNLELHRIERKPLMIHTKSLIKVLTLRIMAFPTKSFRRALR